MFASRLFSKSSVIRKQELDDQYKEHIQLRDRLQKITLLPPLKARRATALQRDDQEASRHKHQSGAITLEGQSLLNT